MAVSSARKVEALRGRGVWVDVAALTESDPKPVLRSVPRDGGTDHHVSRSAGTGKTAQRLWNLLCMEHRGEPYTFAVGFGAGIAGFMAVTYAAWLGCPSLVLVRGNDFDETWFDAERGPWVRETLSRATVVAAISSEMKRRIIALYPGRDVRLVPNGVDVSAWELLPRDEAQRDEIRANPEFDERTIIGLFGELKYKKGLDLWLGALRDANFLDRVGLLVVGDRLDDETIEILTDPVLAPRSVRNPFTDRDRLPGLYRACDFVAIPSLYDGMPNVLLEAMSAGVAPIVSDAGAMGEVVTDGQTGFVFRAQDREAAAEALGRALRLSPSARAAMGAAAREFVRVNYSMERETDALCQILHGAGEPKQS
ncbi:MAG: glycosyltransferase [Desulfomonile tiedjei]|nr:glycosyltransferase [Desulfomonile tiedjei]